MTKKQAKDLYYRRIRENRKACIVKLIDRCNNVSTMAGSFTQQRMIEYIEESEEYILPLADLFSETDEYYPVVFLVRYHLISVLETIKYFLSE